MSPRLGGRECAQKWLEFCNLHLDPKKVPAAADEIAKIITGISD